MAKAAVRPQVHQSLDVDCHFTTQIALDLVVPVDKLPQTHDILIAQLVHPTRIRNPQLTADLPGGGTADAMDIRKRDFDPLLGRNINASNARHYWLSSPGKDGNFSGDMKPVIIGLRLFQSNRLSLFDFCIQL
jgi:hypothetical protein